MDKKRRKLLKAGLGTGATALGWPLASSLGILSVSDSASAACSLQLSPRIQFDPGWFPLGVASGDPTPNAVVIWTRYAPDPCISHGGLAQDTNVIWAMATEVTVVGGVPQFLPEDIVAQGTATAKPANAGAIHIDVIGLSPDTRYFYAFMAPDGSVSSIGATKTAPLGTTTSARFAFLSCQDINNGYYGAFERMVEEDLDFIIHAGDAIYENSLNGAGWPQEWFDLPLDLDRYRLLHAMHRGDPQLRAAYEAVPWFLIWDDHEVYNNYWNADFYPPFLAARAAAYQAWYEHMPIRPPAGVPNGPDFQIYRSFAYGDLLDLMLIDGRQYRDPPPPGLSTEAERNDPNRTMLGAAQKQWLKNELSASTAAWRGLVSNVTMMDIKGDHEDPSQTLTDQWIGYAYERADLLSHIASGQIPDVVVMHGNPHQSTFGNLRVDPLDLQTPVVASEIGGTPITSGPDGPGQTVLEQQRAQLYGVNPHLCYWEPGSKGYVVCDVTINLWVSAIRTVDRFDPDAPAETLATFETVRGVPGINMTSGTGSNPNWV